MGGAGRSTLLATIFGDRRADLDMTLGDEHIVSLTPRTAVGLGIGLVPEDRKRQGLFLEQSILRNAAIAALPPFRLNPMARAREVCHAPLTRLGVKFASVDQPVGQLSGGNQQKVVLAKWMARGIDLLLLDEPTRGSGHRRQGRPLRTGPCARRRRRRCPDGVERTQRTHRELQSDLGSARGAQHRAVRAPDHPVSGHRPLHRHRKNEIRQ
ncbi:MAG: ATP-binding cassette domain-containing protein [Mycobacterium sp.]|nr:ATP-binding cassette domain-containing protein [Mycobacterium sp.]